MRLGLPDLLFAIASVALGTLFWQFVNPEATSLYRIGGGLFVGSCLYLALVYPVYRVLKLLPMILPRCPCCGVFPQGLHILGGDWPRIRFRCPTCDGEFVIWHNGKPGCEESWDHPVLALKWPYALGRYKRMKNPEQDAPSNGG
jgi:hypothetical protein